MTHPGPRVHLSQAAKKAAPAAKRQRRQGAWRNFDMMAQKLASSVSSQMLQGDPMVSHAKTAEERALQDECLAAAAAYVPCSFLGLFFWFLVRACQVVRPPVLVAGTKAMMLGGLDIGPHVLGRFAHTRPLRAVTAQSQHSHNMVTAQSQHSPSTVPQSSTGFGIGLRRVSQPLPPTLPLSGRSVLTHGAQRGIAC